MEQMEQVESLNNLPTLPTAPPGRIKRFWWKIASFFLGLGSGVRWSIVGLYRAACWSMLEISYWYRLFLYTSRRFLRIEVYLALAGAFLFFGWVLDQDKARNMHDLLDACYLFFSVIMVMLCMNLLPRERDEETLEILWSQPMRRGSLIFFQLLTVTIWQVLLSLIVVGFFSYFSAYAEGKWLAVLFLCTTSFTIGAITVLVSTYCRHGIATGLMSLLIIGVHYFWLRPLGPIELFMNPIQLPNFSPYANRMSFFGSLLFNRIIVIALAGFVLDYLFRRLRQTAQWFT